MSDRSLAVDRRAVHSTSNAVLGMVLFVVSESMFLMGFFAVYVSSYASHRVWPPPGIPIPPLGMPTAAAVVLVASAVTMALAGAASRRRDPGLVRWVAATLALSIVFNVLLILSMRGLGFGISDGIYGSLFYVASALAVAHAVGGVVFFVLVLVQAMSGELSLRQDPLQAASIYWYFVVVVGIAVYFTFSLANVGVTS